MSGTAPFVIRRGFNRRPAPDDANLIDLRVETHVHAATGHPEVRVGSIDWSAIFKKERPLRLEIGFGRSDFLVRVAEAAPEFNYVGIEYSAKRVLKFLRRIRERRVSNVRAICCDARDVVERIFAPGTLERVFVLFPDPWPKRRHAKNRFVQTSNLEILHRLCRPEGGLTLRTDDPAYARQMLSVCDAHPGFENLAGTGSYAIAPREPFETQYERKWRKMGREIHFLEYDRVEP